jgi:translation elongation factor EF-Tu-like GTPase
MDTIYNQKAGMYMQAYMCKMCGAGLEPVSYGFCTCQYCGTRYNLSADGIGQITTEFDNDSNPPISDVHFSIVAQGVFSISGRGTVITGEVAIGEIAVGDRVKIIKKNGQRIESAVAGIEQFRKMLDTAKKGDNIGLMLSGVTKAQIEKGDIVIKGELDIAAVENYIRGRYLPTNELIMAIDFYRKATGVGLKEAKNAVDIIFAQRH